MQVSKTVSFLCFTRWRGGRSTPDDTLAQRQFATLDLSQPVGKPSLRLGALERARTVQDTLFELPDTGALVSPPRPLFLLTMVLCDHMGEANIVQYMSHQVSALR